MVLKRKQNLVKVDFSSHRQRHDYDCGKANENNEHFLLRCPLYDVIRQDIFGHLENILEFNVSDMDSKSLCDLLLLGKPDLERVWTK